MANQAADLYFGRGNEITTRGKLEVYLNTHLRHQGAYDIFDFADDTNTTYVELKSRRIRHDAYPTALVGTNKVDACSDPNKDYWFAYCYTDGVYIIKYEKTLFDSFERQDDFLRGARSDCSNNPKRVVKIPTHLLEPI